MVTVCSLPWDSTLCIKDYAARNIYAWNMFSH